MVESEPARQQVEAGVLAIWNDCDPTREAEYEHWYRTEHLLERVRVPGFRSGRRYEIVGGGSPRFFTCYEVDVPGVLVSAAYLERSNNPTVLTRKIMSERILRNLSRTACRRTFLAGNLRGSFVLTVRWDDADRFAADVESAQQLGAQLVEAGHATRTETWKAVAPGTGTVSVEQSLRGGPDAAIAGAVLVEATRDRELAEIARTIATRFEGASMSGYRLLCTLSRQDCAA